MVKNSCLEYIKNTSIKIKRLTEKKNRGHEQGVDKREQAGSL